MPSAGMVIVLLVLLASSVSGCAAAPRQKPLRTTPIAEGPESLQAARARLQGRWQLQSLTVSTEDGRARQVDATGDMAADAFGGLTIEYRITEAGRRELADMGIVPPSTVIATSGKIVINPTEQLITYVGDDFNERALNFDPKLAALRSDPFALEHVRHYVFRADGSLFLSTRYPNGKDAAVGHWRRP